MRVVGLIISYTSFSSTSPASEGVVLEGQWRRKIRFIEGNAKCRHLKKLTCEGTLRKVFICLRPRTPAPYLHTVYMYTVYLFTQGRGKRGES
jgi:hypothetical protein